VKLRRAEPADVDRLADLEARSYPADEAASRETLAYRVENAPECFLLAEDEDGGLLGFVCGKLTSSEHLTAAAMGTHEPEGTRLGIHSVVIDPERRRSGLGTQLVGGYLERVAADLPAVDTALLICKEHLKGFYGSNGFQLVGLSEVVHGADPWWEMKRPLR
jgi:ribosomal protein S18 acetylase RimI-like enzyme